MALEGITELRKYIRNMSKVVNVSAESARNTFIKKSEALIKTRVFTQGKGDANGNRLSPYKSDYYKKKRSEERRQIANKDLEFTGTLRSSIQPIFKKGITSLEITPIEYPSGVNTQEVAKYQEAYQQNIKIQEGQSLKNRVIFRLSESELDIALKDFEFQFKKEFKKLTSA